MSGQNAYTVNGEHELVGAARRLATAAHEGQVRRGASGRPYIAHCQEVASLVEAHGGDVDMVAAAWLHDTVEDSALTIEVIEHECGPVVGMLVLELTNPPEWARLSMPERKARQARDMATRSDRAKLIKLADQYANVREMLVDPPVSWSPERQRKYAAGARQVVDACRPAAPSLAALFDALPSGPIQ